jgi:Domain of unknown function (DUF4440)
MWATLWPLSALLWVTLGLRPTPSQGSEDVEQVLLGYTQELLDAITTGTASVWESRLDSAVSYTTEDGVVRTKVQMVADVKPLPPGVSGSIRVTDFRVSLHGPVAVTTHVDDEQESYYGHKLHCQYRTTDTWLKTGTGWHLIAGQVIALRTDPPALSLTPQQMAEYVGRYQLTPEIAYEIRREAAGLVGQQTGRKRETLQVEVRDVLFVPGRPRYRKVFRRDSEGRITDFAERREAWDLVWTRAR